MSFSSLENINILIEKLISSDIDALPLKYISKFINDFSSLLSEPDHHDIEIRVGVGRDLKTFKAHTNILKTRSSYFKAALADHWVKRSQNGIMVFEKENISPKVFEVLLTYIYNGIVNVDKLDPNEIFELLEACDELCFNELIAGLQDHLIKKGTKWLQQNMIYLYKVSSKHQSFNLLQDYCYENPEFFFEPGAIEKSMLKSILEKDDLSMDEIDIWDLVIQWGVKQIENLEEEKRKKTIESEQQLSPKHKKPKINKLDEPISEWSDDDLNELKVVLEEFIPLIRFNQIASCDFYDKISPFKSIFNNEIYIELIEYYLNSDKWKPKLLLQKGPRIRKSLLNLKRKCLISNWVENSEIYNNSNLPYDFSLILRGSQDGFSRKVFQDKCFNIEKTVVIMKIKETGELVGGYNPVCWNIKDMSPDEEYEITGDFFTFKIDESQISNSTLNRFFEIYINNSESANCVFDGVKIHEIFLDFGNLALFNSVDEPYCFRTEQIPNLHLLEEVEIYKLLKKY